MHPNAVPLLGCCPAGDCVRVCSPSSGRVRPSPWRLRGSRDNTHFLTETWFQSAHPDQQRTSQLRILSEADILTGACQHSASRESTPSQEHGIESGHGLAGPGHREPCVTGAGEKVLCRELVARMPCTHWFAESAVLEEQMRRLKRGKRPVRLHCERVNNKGGSVRRCSRLLSAHPAGNDAQSTRERFVLRGLRIRRAMDPSASAPPGVQPGAARVQRTAAGPRVLPIAVRAPMDAGYLRAGPAKSRISRR